MKSLIWIIASVVLLVLSNAGVAEEVYQYIDENGNPAFTDDVSRVPEAQQPEAPPVLPDKSGAALPEATAAGPPEVGSEPAEAAAGGLTEGALDTEKARLDALFEQLEAEKKRLSEVSAQPLKGSRLNAHKEKIKDLNARIRQYRQETEAFKEKVRTFNAQLTEKAPQ